MFFKWSCLILYFYINGLYSQENDCSRCRFNNPKISEDIYRLKPFCGKRFSTTDIHEHDGSKYTYHVGICSNYTKNYDSALQVDDKKETHVIGRLNNTDFTVAGKVLLLEYHDGDKYRSHCGNGTRNTLIVMYCDPNEYEGKFSFVDENKDLTKDCQYVFILAHKDVCSDEAYSLSAGAIVLLVVFPVMLAYIVLGMFYKKCIKNAMGWEIMPNFNFWKEFGALQADGCNFIFRCGNTFNDAEYDERLLT